jgi:hypothetical protein
MHAEGHKDAILWLTACKYFVRGIKHSIVLRRPLRCGGVYRGSNVRLGRYVIVQRDKLPQEISVSRGGLSMAEPIRTHGKKRHRNFVIVLYGADYYVAPI